MLEQYLPSVKTVPSDLHQAMRYVVLGGGKRIRAALVYATGEALGANLEELDIPAAAVELIHAYSLVHDDLPAMDNDDLRHGKPTCHLAFNEALAILTGDALQALAFELLANHQVTINNGIQRLTMITILAKAISSIGMVGGQALDLAAEKKPITLEQLEDIHSRKTGALITASIQLGVVIGGCADRQQWNLFELFAKKIGLAFQVQDDILDIESSTETLGKTQGADLAKQKATYPGLLGMQAAKEKLNKLYQHANQHLVELNLADSNLKNLAEYIIQRDY